MKRKIILFLLKAVAALPLRALYLLSDLAFFIIYHLIGYRRKVVSNNLTEAFPEKSPNEIKKIEKEYYHYMCDIIVETVKLLNISERQMGRRVEVVNPELIQQAVDGGRPAVIMLGHYGNWEWVQEISRHFKGDAFKASIYHPLKSQLWNDIYARIRSRWAVNIIPQKSAVRTLLDKNNLPWICGFIADHRPLTVTDDNITPFLNHATSFIYGPEVLGSRLGADFFLLEMERIKRGRYRITFHTLEPETDGKPYPYTRSFWRRFEEVIKRKPAYWLWSHKRWKYDRLLEK